MVLVPPVVRPRLTPVAMLIDAALAVGGSLDTTTATVVDFTRPQFAPTIRKWYVPGFVVAGAVTVAVAAVAVHPNRLGTELLIVQPVGTWSKLSPTRSKNVELRVRTIGTDAVPPWDPMSTSPPVVESENVPSGPRRRTSSSGSWVLSGSVEVFQPKLPR